MEAHAHVIAFLPQWCFFPFFTKAEPQTESKSTRIGIQTCSFTTWSSFYPESFPVSVSESEIAKRQTKAVLFYFFFFTQRSFVLKREVKKCNLYTKFQNRSSKGQPNQKKRKKKSTFLNFIVSILFCFRRSVFTFLNQIVKQQAK